MIFEEPTYLYQFGFNGQTVVRRGLENDHIDGVILSPTDFEHSKTTKLAREVNQEDKYVFFDPQFYIPRTDKAAADSYSYFEQSGGENFQTVVVSDGSSREELCEQIFEIQKGLGVDAYISPARYLDTFSNRKLGTWEDLTRDFIELVNERSDKPVLASLPVSGGALTDNQAKDKLLDRVTSLNPDGFYVSVQFERYRSYPLQGSNEVRAYLDLLKSLRFNNFEVLPGHTHQISHLLFGLGINAFASGHFKNTKAFDIDRWIPEDDGFGQGGVYYYYSDPVLNEFRTEQGLQNLFAQPGFDIGKVRMDGSPYEGALFMTSPEGATWKLSEAEWDHYVWACYTISRLYRGKTIEERTKTAERVIKAAKHIHNDIVESAGPQDNLVDVYDDWESAFYTVQDPMYFQELEWILQ